MAYRLLILKWAVLGFLLFGAFALAARDEPQEAWWLTATFAPTETAYDSLPVSDINSDWVRIAVITYANLPAEAKEDTNWMKRDGFRFQVDNYFKRKGVADRVLCGVYEDRKGRRGRFLLVLEKQDEHWKVAYLHHEFGEAGFSVLVKRRNGLFWGLCMQCGDFGRIMLIRGSFELETAP